MNVDVGTSARAKHKGIIITTPGKAYFLSNNFGEGNRLFDTVYVRRRVVVRCGLLGRFSGRYFPSQ